jgi:hypothetical protein
MIRRDSRPRRKTTNRFDIGSEDDTKHRRLPDFIVVGPPRTGTTWLDRVLRGHVELPADLKETQFFAWNFGLGINWYAAFFRNCDPLSLAGEIAPTYFDKPIVRSGRKSLFAVQDLASFWIGPNALQLRFAKAKAWCKR